MVLERIISKEGYQAEVSNNLFIVLDTTLNEELINEGLARETISKIQQMRKNIGLDIVDRINICYESDKTYEDSISGFKEFIMSEVLATKFTSEKNDGEICNINGYDVKIKIEKV